MVSVRFPSVTGSMSGRSAAASRTSSLPVTTSAIRRVRYSRRRAIWRLAVTTASSHLAATLNEALGYQDLFIGRGHGCPEVQYSINRQSGLGGCNRILVEVHDFQ